LLLNGTEIGVPMSLFFQINIIYGGLSDFCTRESCPVMCATNDVEYLWSDPVKQTKTEKLAACDYCVRLFDWIQSLLDNPSVFPPTKDQPWPKNYQEVVQKIFQRLFRVYAHLYLNHFQKVVALGAEATMNSHFKHFVIFAFEFKLLDQKKDCDTLKDLIGKLIK